MERQWMATRVGWAILGSVALTTSLGCSSKADAPEGAAGAAGTTSDKTTNGGSGGDATGGSGGNATGGSGGNATGGSGAVGGSGGSGGGVTDSGAGGETGSGPTSSTSGSGGGDGDAGGGGEAPVTGGSGGTDGLNHVPVQRRADGLWPDLDQILPRELGDDDAKCRITQWREGGEFFQSWTWQYNQNNGQPIRLTHEWDDIARTVVFDEQGRYWTMCAPCFSSWCSPSEWKCALFSEPTPLAWTAWYYEEVCPGAAPAEDGFEQGSEECFVPSSRDDKCEGPHDEDTWQFTQDGRLRIYQPDWGIAAIEDICYIDDVLRATGSASDLYTDEYEYYPDGSLESAKSWSDNGEDSLVMCDDTGWLVDMHREDDVKLDTAHYSFSGDDPLHPDEVVVEFDYFDGDCSPAIAQSGTWRAKLEWTADSVEIQPDPTTDPLLAATWSFVLYSESRKLDDAGNVVEISLVRSGQEELREVYTFEGEGACVRGTNPHLFLEEVYLKRDGRGGCNRRISASWPVCE